MLAITATPAMANTCQDTYGEASYIMHAHQQGIDNPTLMRMTKETNPTIHSNRGYLLRLDTSACLRPREGNMKKLILLTITIVQFTTPAGADYFYSGNQLKAYCNGGPGSVYRNTCEFYVAGVVSTDQIFADIYKKEAFVCLPSGVTPASLGEVVRNHLNAETEYMDQNGAGHALRAVMRAFPCNKQ